MIKIIDSVMGSGKTTYILNYMKKNPDKKYFVVTPFLSEIERIIKEAHFLKEPLD
jgi:DNA transposition AAA+ family ATPase